MRLLFKYQCQEWYFCQNYIVVKNDTDISKLDKNWHWQEIYNKNSIFMSTPDLDNSYNDAKSYRSKVFRLFGFLK